jgi:hypothetical protein
MPQKTLSDDITATIRATWASGCKNLSEIARKAGCSRASVKAYLDLDGARDVRPNNPMPEPDVADADVYAAWRKYKSTLAVGAMFKMRYREVEAAIARCEGIPARG